MPLSRTSFAVKFAFAIAALASLTTAAALYDSDSPVVSLDAKTFTSRVTNDVEAFVLVEFYAPWCGRLQEARARVRSRARAEEVQDRRDARGGGRDAHKSLCDAHGVSGFPRSRRSWPAARRICVRPSETYAGRGRRGHHALLRGESAGASIAGRPSGASFGVRERAQGSCTTATRERRAQKFCSRGRTARVAGQQARLVELGGGEVQAGQKRTCGRVRTGRGRQKAAWRATRHREWAPRRVRFERRERQQRSRRRAPPTWDAESGIRSETRRRSWRRSFARRAARRLEARLEAPALVPPRVGSGRRTTPSTPSSPPSRARRLSEGFAGACVLLRCARRPARGASPSTTHQPRYPASTATTLCRSSGASLRHELRGARLRARVRSG